MIATESRQLAAEFHVMHCDAEDSDSPGHVCQGRISINARCCTFECPRCGSDCINIQPQVESLQDLRVMFREECFELTKKIKDSIDQECPFNIE